MSDQRRGVYEKYLIERTDGKSAPGQKHAECDYFVLDLMHDPFAVPALRAYAEACKEKYPLLARDVLAKVGALASTGLEDPGTKAGVQRLMAGLDPDPWKPLDPPCAETMEEYLGRMGREAHAARINKIVGKPLRYRCNDEPSGSGREAGEGKEKE